MVSFLKKMEDSSLIELESLVWRLPLLSVLFYLLEEQIVPRKHNSIPSLDLRCIFFCGNNISTVLFIETRLMIVKFSGGFAEWPWLKPVSRYEMEELLKVRIVPRSKQDWLKWWDYFLLLFWHLLWINVI